MKYPRVCLLLIILLLAACGSDQATIPAERENQATIPAEQENDAGIPPPANQLPVARAGADREVHEGAAVSLDGSGSDDPDGTIISFSWRQTDGPAVSLTGADSATLSFVAPAVAGSTTLSFELRVRDAQDAAALDAVQVMITDTTLVSVGDAIALEGDTGSAPLSFPVSLNAAQPATVTVQFATEPGSATADEDYTANTGTLNFAPGETEKQLTVEIAGDSLNESDETFQVVLSGIQGVGAGDTAATGIISDASCAPDNLASLSYPHRIGALHEHSGYSDGTPATEPRDYFAAGKAKGLDFMGGAEHSDNADLPITVNDDCLSDKLLACVVADNDDPVDALRKWDATLEQARSASDSGFTAFRGFEWTSDRFGHINVFFSRHDWNAKTTEGYAVSMESLWAWFVLPAETGGGNDGVMVFNHPGREDGLHPFDPAYAFEMFRRVSEADLRVVGVEVFGKGGEAYDVEEKFNPPPGGWYAHALDQGWHIGPVGAEDEHGTNWGSPVFAKTVLIARDRGEAALREALLARRFYALAQHHNDLRLSFSADGAPMGARLSRPSGGTVTLSGALTAGVLDGSLEIVTHAGEVVAQTTRRNLNHSITVPSGKETWFYLRAKDSAGEPVAYSAPIWIWDRGYAACPALAIPPSTSSDVRIEDTGTELRISDGVLTARIAKPAWRLTLERDGKRCMSEADPALPDPATNPDFALHDNRANGIDSAYPGLTDASYQPLAYRTQAWQRVTAARGATASGREARVLAETSDGAGAEITLAFGGDGALELRFRPAAAGVAAVEESFDAPADQRYFGGGQRFHGLNQRGKTLPLWISHGVGSDRYYSTNEIAASFFWSPSGWGAWAASDARGEINFGLPYERPDAVNVVVEDDHLDVVLYCGTPQEIVSTHTARAGRPQWTPPDWMWEPMVWNDGDPTSESTRAMVDGMKERAIPLGVVWLDNPWDAGKASFDFDPKRFPDPDALIREVHDKGVRFMVWISPFVTSPHEETARANGWLVNGTRPDNADATYFNVTNPPDFSRGLSPHLDFTHPGATAWWQAGLEKLIARGIDGVKVDRGEEDLSDDSVWFNGLPNRLNHNAYIDRFHHAIFDAFSRRRGEDFAILARGGWNGSARWSGHWAADNLSAAGALGLGQALNSLLSLSASGFPFNGADVGGYVGLRQDMGEDAAGNPLLPPTENLYIRWTQLGALSPVMQTPVPPWWVSDAAVANYRTYAELHHRLVPYIAAAAREAVERGVPIVRPLPYAFPSDPVAVAIEDQYLFGPDLLVAPVTNVDSDAPASARTVYLPAGRWTNFWSGLAYDGPLLVPVAAPLEQIPLFVRAGAALPPGVRAGALP